MKLRFSLLALALLSTASLMAIPASPTLLRSLLEKGDTARYEQMIRHDRQLSYRTSQSLARRAAARRAESASEAANAFEFGYTPYLAPKGLFIVVNFSDKQLKSTTTAALVDSMMNGYNYTYNGATGSAAQYLSDQSNGTYRPHFGVVGPVTLPKKMSYYGGNDENGYDMYPADMVLHACSIASQLPGVNLADYDCDGDGKIDFVYVLYAGYGEADSDVSNSVWPASDEMDNAVSTGWSSLSQNASPSSYTFDGVRIGTYAYSNELNGSGSFNGISTPLHEFSHVLGLPDLYDTYYGSNQSKTPGSWDIMDNGSYNNDGRTPPCYSAWEKQFLGFAQPVNPGSQACDITLAPNGSADYHIIQVNASGKYQGATATGVCYLLESRQKAGWDAYLPGSGLLVWKVDYNRAIFNANEPNSSYSSDYGSPQVNTSGKLCLTIQPASGSKVESAAATYPGSKNVTSWSAVSDRPVTNITRYTDGSVTFSYMGGGDELPLALDEVEAASSSSAVKLFIGGQICILRDGLLYSLTGQRL